MHINKLRLYGLCGVYFIGVNNKVYTNLFYTNLFTVVVCGFCLKPQHRPKHKPHQDWRKKA